MPPNNGVTSTGAYIKLMQTVGNASNVSLNVDPGAVATIGDIEALETEITSLKKSIRYFDSAIITLEEELETEIADLKGFIGYSDDDIYGLEVDFKNGIFTRLAGAENLTPGADFDKINAFGGRKRCNVKDDGTVTAYYGDASYTTTGKMADGTHVQVMVEQPKFYYKVVPTVIKKSVNGVKIIKARYYISDTPKVGFKVHPAFIENGKVNSYIYLAAFEGSLYDTSANAYILNNAQVADFTADKESRAGWKGLCRKGVTLFVVLVACRLDLIIGSDFIRDAVVIAFTANETISIIENAGLMGVPIPPVITKAIEVLKNKAESEVK